MFRGLYFKYIFCHFKYNFYYNIVLLAGGGGGGTLVGNKLVDLSDVAGAAPVGAAPTTSSFST